MLRLAWLGVLAVAAPLGCLATPADGTESTEAGLSVPLEAALVLGDGEADSAGNAAGCGATRLGADLLLTARHCAEGGAQYVTVLAGTGRRDMHAVAKGARWIAAGRAPSRAHLYGNDMAFLLTEAPLPDEVPIGTVTAAHPSGPVTTNVLAWSEQSAEPRSYELTAYERELQSGPFGVADDDGNQPVRAGELYRLESLVASGDSGTALVDPDGAVRGVVSRGLRAQDLPEPPPDADPRDFVGGVWATVAAFCERITAEPDTLIVSEVVDWRLEEGDPVEPTNPAEQAGVDAVRALCAP